MAVKYAEGDGGDYEENHSRWVQKLYEWSAKDKDAVDLEPQKSSRQHQQPSYLVQYHPVSYKRPCS